MKVFIDLESTVIDTWENCNLYPKGIRQIKDFINKMSVKITELDIFSYAVYNIKDIIFFRKYIAPLLADAFGVKINIPISVEDYISIAQAELKCKMSQDDFFTFMKKDIFFPLFVRWLAYKNVYCTDKVFVLFDDMVETCSILKPDYTIRMIKV